MAKIPLAARKITKGITGMIKRLLHSSQVSIALIVKAPIVAKQNIINACFVFHCFITLIIAARYKG